MQKLKQFQNWPFISSLYGLFTIVAKLFFSCKIKILTWQVNVRSLGRVAEVRACYPTGPTPFSNFPSSSSYCFTILARHWSLLWQGKQGRTVRFSRGGKFPPPPGRISPPPPVNWFYDKCITLFPNLAFKSHTIQNQKQGISKDWGGATMTCPLPPPCPHSTRLQRRMTLGRRKKGITCDELCLFKIYLHHSRPIAPMKFDTN